MLELRTNQLKTRKKVKIDGHEYTVRRMGNIERIDMSQYLRRMKQLAALEDKGPLTQIQLDEVQSISDKCSLMFVDLFDDGGDQTRSRALVASLDELEIGMLIGQIFDDSGTGETHEPEPANER